MKKFSLIFIALVILIVCRESIHSNQEIVQRNIDTTSKEIKVGTIKKEISNSHEKSGSETATEVSSELLYENVIINNEEVFVYKFNILRDELVLNETQLAVYERLSKAVEERETAFEIAPLDINEFQDVIFSYAWSNPLSSLINFINSETDVLNDENEIVLSYKFSENEHNKYIEAWKKQIEDIFENYVDLEESDSVVAKQLYMYTVSNIEYDYSRLDGDNPTDTDLIGTSYYALIYGKGICKDYASIYNYLLNQAGINCMFVHGAGHAWSIVELDGLYYHCDPTFERNHMTGDTNLEEYEPVFFGMSNDFRLNTHYAKVYKVTTNVYDNIEIDIHELIEIADSNYKFQK